MQMAFGARYGRWPKTRSIPPRPRSPFTASEADRHKPGPGLGARTHTSLGEQPMPGSLNTSRAVRIWLKLSTTVPSRAWQCPLAKSQMTAGDDRTPFLF
jgi:hypothetical protein